MKSVLITFFFALVAADCGYGFTAIPWQGAVKHVTTSPNFLWSINSKDQIFICNKPCTGRWRQIAGGLMQVDADDYEVWDVNSRQHIYKRLVDGGGRWIRIGGGLKHVTASGNGYIWGVNGGDNIYVCAKPCTGRWKHIGGKLKQVDGGQDRVYGVNSGGAIYTRPIDGSGRWRHIPFVRNARPSQITAGDTHEVFVTTTTGDLYRCQKPCVGEWEKVSGQRLNQVDADSSGLYGLDSNSKNIMVKKFTKAA